MSNHRLRGFSTAFKEGIVRRLESGEALAAVSKELGIARKLLYEWRWAWRRHGSAGLNRRRGPNRAEAEDGDRRSAGGCPGRRRGSKSLNA
jgi:transposase